MPASKAEQVLMAIKAVLETVPGAVVERNSVLPEKVPAGGLIILRDGDPGEPEQALGGFGSMVERTGCQITGADIEPAAIEHANAEARRRGLEDRSTFAVVDCSGRLPFEDGAFGAVLCIDAISHLPDRFGTLLEWARLLVRGGRLLFTDSTVLTGAVAKSELDIRGGIGFFLVVPPGLDEEAIEAAGLILLKREDRTAATAEVATRLHAARARRAAALEREEGADWFGQRQRLLATTAELAQSHRLSRFLYVAEKSA
jgi:SAM-dependent methyltransferase